MRSLFLSTAAAAAAAALVAATLPSVAAAPNSPLTFTVRDINGKPVPLRRYQGNVVLIVNTASKCGNTPQYGSLEKLYQKYKGRGLRVLAFPANNFGAQEPGTDTEIKTFCNVNYRTTFPLFSKVSVKGHDQVPLYRFLTSKQTNPRFGGDVEWNFAKFLVGRDGKVVGRFPAGQDPLAPDVVSAVEAQLAKKPAAARRAASTTR
jgi:glutathione peroxidase